VTKEREKEDRLKKEEDRRRKVEEGRAGKIAAE
jgi:hypothetical protein